MQDNEKFYPIKGFEGYYEINRNGQIKICARKIIRLKCVRVIPEKIKRPSICPKGYHRMQLHIGSIQKTCSVHRLVAEAFIPNPKNKKEVNHKNGIKSDNRADNLEWCTRSENMKHAFDTGLKIITQKHIDITRARVSKKMIDTKTGIIYNSLREAAIALKMNTGTLRNNFTPKRKNNTSLIWKTD